MRRLAWIGAVGLVAVACNAEAVETFTTAAAPLLNLTVLEFRVEVSV